MARESSAAKARRHLATGRVRIRAVDRDGTVQATVAGDHGRYEVLGIYLASQGRYRWRCTCPAWTHHCSHVIAVALVTDPQGPAMARDHDHPDRRDPTARKDHRWHEGNDSPVTN